MTTKKIVILGTGGTIAGQAASNDENLSYTAAQLGVNQLVAAVPCLSQLDGLLCEQVAQIDSKDMTFKVWTELATRVQHHLAQDDVGGVVITHGTDTLEETAYFLQIVLHPLKPVILTCAMRHAPCNGRSAGWAAKYSGCCQCGALAWCAGGSGGLFRGRAQRSGCSKSPHHAA